jgi:hypothetical protein
VFAVHVDNEMFVRLTFILKQFAQNMQLLTDRTDEIGKHAQIFTTIAKDWHERQKRLAAFDLEGFGGPGYSLISMIGYSTGPSKAESVSQLLNIFAHQRVQPDDPPKSITALVEMITDCMDCDDKEDKEMAATQV